MHCGYKIKSEWLCIQRPTCTRSVGGYCLIHTKLYSTIDSSNRTFNFSIWSIVTDICRFISGSINCTPVWLVGAFVLQQEFCSRMPWYIWSRVESYMYSTKAHATHSLKQSWKNERVLATRVFNSWNALVMLSVLSWTCWVLTNTC